VRASVDNPDDPFSLVRIEGDDLSGESAAPRRGSQHHSLFGGRRAIWVKPTSRNIASAVESLLGATSPDCRVVIEAGDLKNLRRSVRCANARRMPWHCPVMQTASAISPRLIDDEMKQAGLSIAARCARGSHSLPRRRPRGLPQ
jgi:DNA polymerase-3 subunit delta